MLELVTVADLIKHCVQKAFSAATLGLMLAMLMTLSFVAVETNLDDLEVSGRTPRSVIDSDQVLLKGSSSRTTAGVTEGGGTSCKAETSCSKAVPLPTIATVAHATSEVPRAGLPVSAPRPHSTWLANAAGARGPPLAT